MKSCISVAGFPCIADFADSLGLSYELVRDRLASGWTVEEITKTPSLPKGKRRPQPIR